MMLMSFWLAVVFGNVLGYCIGYTLANWLYDYFHK